jgi:phosphomannomutase
MQFHRAIFGSNEQGNYIHPTISNESEPFASTLLLLSALARDEKHKYMCSFAEENDVVNKELFEETTYSLHSEAVDLFKRIYNKDTDNRTINTLYGVKIIENEKAWTHIYSTIVPNKVSVKVCSESPEERKNIMEQTLQMIENLDKEISH